MRKFQSISLALLLLLVLVCLFPACASHEAQATPAATPSPQRVSHTAASEDGSVSTDEQDTEAEDQSSDDDADSEPKEFHGYQCKADCSGHEAGYAWAEAHDIHDPDRCGGKSESFIEGCRAWAEENTEDDPN